MLVALIAQSDSICPGKKIRFPVLPACCSEASALLSQIATGFGSNPEVLDTLLVNADGQWFSGMQASTAKVIMDQAINRMMGVPAISATLVEPLIRLVRTLIGAQHQQEARTKLTNLGLQLWPSAKGAALKLLQAAEGQVAPVQMAELVTGIDVDDETQRQQLADAWQALLRQQPSGGRADVLKTLFTLRPKAGQHLLEFIEALLANSADAASLARDLLSETNAADFDDLWKVVLRKPGNIAPETIGNQAVSLLCGGRGVSTLEKYDAQMFMVLGLAMQQQMAGELQRRAFDEQVPQQAAELAAAWMYRIDSRSLNRVNDFPKGVRERVKQIRDRVREGQSV